MCAKTCNCTSSCVTPAPLLSQELYIPQGSTNAQHFSLGSSNSSRSCIICESHKVDRHTFLSFYSYKKQLTASEGLSSVVLPRIKLISLPCLTWAASVAAVKARAPAAETPPTKKMMTVSWLLGKGCFCFSPNLPKLEFRKFLQNKVTAKIALHCSTPPQI